MAKSTAITKVATTTKNALQNTGKAIASNPNTTLYVGLGLLSVFAVYQITKYLKPDTSSGGGNLDKSNRVPYGATISENQAEVIAAALHQAMVVWNGTNENRIYELLTGKNKKDFSMISNSFGKPRYDDFGDAYFPFPKKSLSYWLYSELEDDEILKLKQVMPNVI
ncbi:hypothetical protein [Maribacter sp.]|uniref:hypothetical protein n=1 Tax=Maribacter sp. TaxID=1897614 RepID=UPI0025BBCB58|nr:hypothetical protein [Maribacter sp.]